MGIFFETTVAGIVSAIDVVDGVHRQLDWTGNIDVDEPEVIIVKPALALG